MDINENYQAPNTPPEKSAIPPPAITCSFPFTVAVGFTSIKDAKDP